MNPHTSTVYLVGNPNTGKTTLFNALSGHRARVGNYPGITVEQRWARVDLPGAKGQAPTPVKLVDLPGAYSLHASSAEEHITSETLRGIPGCTSVLYVANATILERSLYFLVQLLESSVPVVVAVNMMDEVTNQGLRLAESTLETGLGVPVVGVSASKGVGLEKLQNTIHAHLNQPREPLRLDYDPSVRAELSHNNGAPPMAALWKLLETQDLQMMHSVVTTRYAHIEHVTQEALVPAPARKPLPIHGRSQRPLGQDLGTSHWDRVLTHPLWGTLLFATLMALLFESLFSWSEPVMSLVEQAIAGLQGAALASLPTGPLRDLLVEGVIAGVGNVLVFVPQILVLFLFVGFLEDAGYLARAAYLLDRIMRAVGLQGRAFVPYLSGFACAIPAIMATRTLESRRDRLVAMLTIPLTSCSARLPIYALVIGLLFTGEERLFGVLSVGGALLALLYLFSIGTALAAAAILRRTILKGPSPHFVLELPPFRWPDLGGVLTRALEKVKAFVVEAGTIILAMTVVLWALLSFPAPPSNDTGEGADSSQDPHARLVHSAAGRLGHALEPVLQPIGFDWRMGVGLMGAFAAREVFVSTMGVVFGIEASDEDVAPLRHRLREAKRDDGSPLFTPLTACSLLVFFLFACQCMATVAVVHRESGSWKWPALLLLYSFILAYVSSLLVYQGGKLLGFT